MDEIKILFLSHTVDYSKAPYDTGNQFIQALRNNNAAYLSYVQLYNKYGHYGAHHYLKKYVRDNGINCLIYGSSPSEFYFDINYLEKLRKEVFLVMMTGDTEYYYEIRDQYYAQAMDLVTVNDFISTFKLRQIGINSIPYYAYYDSTKYSKNGNLAKDIDVSFIGTLHGGAGRWHNIMHLSANGINIETFGSDSPNGRITFEKKIEIINRSKINLDFSGVSGKTRLTRKHQIYKRMKQIKGKVFEYTMCGSFALCEYAPGLEYFFEVGKEIDIFHDKEELLEKIKYYLAHEEEREKIAQKGYERALKDYAVERAVPKLISIIDGLRKTKTYKPSEIYLDEEFIRNYTTYRTLLIIRFITQLKFKFAFEELKIILKYRKLDLYQIVIFFKEEILDMFPRIKSVLKSIFRRQ
ncbi:MAG: hypothetical protein A2X54_03225 [Nitrospirae bacterium GWF2_44_13]|nr:MAG: hypothetical protein A2X54_03225 [Nitrospirae bacterium GWF2_44_13]